MVLTGDTKQAMSEGGKNGSGEAQLTGSVFTTLQGSMSWAQVLQSREQITKGGLPLQVRYEELIVQDENLIHP